MKIPKRSPLVSRRAYAVTQINRLRSRLIKNESSDGSVKLCSDVIRWIDKYSMSTVRRKVAGHLGYYRHELRLTDQALQQSPWYNRPVFHAISAVIADYVSTADQISKILKETK